MEYTEKILVVDDIAAMRQLLGTVLKQMGYGNVFYAASGEEALEIIQKESFSIVMLDINLPGMSGLETLHGLREIDAGLFVAMVSAHHSAANVKTAIAAGVDGFIVKPYQGAKINEVMRKYRGMTATRRPLPEVDW